MNSTQELLHKRFNKRSDHIPPVRCKNFKREHLALLFNELGYKTGAEVGVAFGDYSELLCKSIPGLNLYCVDPYIPYKRGETLLRGVEEQENRMATAHTRLINPFGVTFIRKEGYEAAKDIPDNSLDFVYIDGDHSFDYVMLDLIAWTRKVRPGGIVSGHDFYRFRGAGVVDAVEAFTHAHQVHEWFVCDEREVSWFWAK